MVFCYLIENTMLSILWYVTFAVFYTCIIASLVHNYKIMNQVIFSALALSAIVAPAMAANWGTDLPAALTQAAAEKKNVLVLFTGSDWCPPCKALKANVLEKPEFDAFAKDKYVLVEIDLPNQKQLPEGLLEKNRELSQKMKIEAFPTMLVLNPDGIVTAGFLGGRENVEQVSQALAVSDAMTAALAAAASAPEAAKAKALYDVYMALPADLRGTNADLIAQIKALDTEDTLGLNKAEQAKAAAQLEMQRIQGRLTEAGSDLAALPAAIKIVEEELAKPDLLPEAKVFLMEVKLQILMIKAETNDDILAIQAYLYELAKETPENAAQIKQFADGIMIQADGILKNAAAQREAMSQAK